MFELLVFIVGVSLGCAITQVIFWNKRVGDLRVDTSDPDGPFLFLELNKELTLVTAKDVVVLRVKKEDYIPHE